MTITLNQNYLLSCFFAISLLAPAAHGAANQPDQAQNFAPATTPQAADSNYDAGTKALDQNRWQDAVTDFEQVAKTNSSKADAALYWKAYALTKLDKLDLANDTCSQLRAQFHSSRWNQDCEALHLREQIRTASRQNIQISVANAKINRGDLDPNGNRNPDDDIKILALNSLMNRDPAQALPLLRGILTGDQTISIKKHALFVLSQSKAPEADGLWHDLIVGKMGPELQREAIQSSGIYRKRHVDADALVEAYRTTSDDKVRRSIISAFFIAGDDSHLVDLARAEKNMELKRQIVSQLAIMNGKAAQDYMLELLK